MALSIYILSMYSTSILTRIAIAIDHISAAKQKNRLTFILNN